VDRSIWKLLTASDALGQFSRLLATLPGGKHPQSEHASEAEPV
jgi:hypothetical protein